MSFKKRLGRTLFVIVTVPLLLAGSLSQHPVQARSLSIPDIEKEALIALYNSTDGDNWTNNSGWLTDPDPCNWYGVKCSGGYVGSIVLSRNNLSGTIPPEMGDFSQPGRLDLSENKLSGSIPSELGNLTDPSDGEDMGLYLSLDRNALSGEIPSTITDIKPHWNCYLQRTEWICSPSFDLGYNMLVSSNSEVIFWLSMDLADPDWADTQTVLPNDILVISATTDSVELSWTPILYTGDGGYYEIGYATSPSGPYTLHGRTSDKTTSGYVVDHLDSNTDYYFAVRTYTPAHGDQQNDLLTGYSEAIHQKTLLFGDVQSDHWAHDFIEAIYNAGLTSGCSAEPSMYCPDDTVTRAQIAVFLENGIHYPNWYSPPDMEPTFRDTAGHWAEDWIEALYRDGITAGCSADPLLYCPDQGTTRAQMAVFLLKSKHGAGYSPPDVEPTFNDTISHWAEDWIEQLYSEGITAGCGNGNYCPHDPVTRAQMAVFLTRTFYLPVP